MNIQPRVLIIICFPAVVIGQSPTAVAPNARSHAERFATQQMLAERAATEETTRLVSNPNDAEALNSRALARMRLGRYHEVYEDLRRALGLGPTNAEHQANLGYVLWKLGRVTEARIGASRGRAFDDARLVHEKNFSQSGVCGCSIMPILGGQNGNPG